MATNIVFFLLAVTINIIILLVFKKLDDDHKNDFSKVTKFCRQFKQDLDKDFEEKKIRLQDFDNCLDASLQRGTSMLNQLNNAVSSFDADSGKVSVSPEMMKRIGELESKISSMEDRPYSPGMSNMPSGIGTNNKELYNILVGLKRDTAAMMKELEKKKKEANDSYRLFESRMKSEIEAKKNNILDFVKLQETQFSENEKKFQKELDRIDGEIAKMNKNFIKDASQNFNLLNQDYRMKYDDLSKKYADMEAEYNKKLETKIKDYSAYISRIEGRCTSLEESVIKELEKARDEYLLDLAAKFTTEKSDIGKFNEQLKTNAKAYILKTIKDNEEKSKSFSETFRKNEMQAQVTLKRYEDFLKDSSERLETCKNDFTNSLEQRLSDFNGHLDASRQQGIKLELEIFNEIKNKLETFRRDTDKSMETLKSKLDSDIAGYDKQISTKYASIKEDYSAMTLNFNELTTKYEKFTDSFAKTIESNRKLYSEQESELNNKADALRSTIESGLASWNASFSAEKKRIEDLFAVDKKELDDKRDAAAEQMSETIAKYESMMSQSVDNVRSHFEEQRTKIFAEIDSIVEQIENNAAGKTGEISAKFDKTYSDFEQKLTVIQENMLQKASGIEQTLLSKSDEINAHLIEEMDAFKASVSERSSKFESEINDENAAIIEQVKTFKGETQQKIADERRNVEANIETLKESIGTAQTQLTDKLQNIESMYYDKGRQLLETNQTELSGYMQRFAQLSDNISELQKTIEQKLYTLVGDGTKQIEDLFAEGSQSLTSRYNALSDETAKQIADYKSDLAKIRKTINDLDTAYDTKFNAKIDFFTTQFGTKLDKFDGEFKLNIARITEDAKSYQDSFEKQIASLRKQISNDYDTFAEESQTRFDSLQNDYNALNDNLTQMKLKIDQDVGNKIAEGKSKLDKEYEVLHADLDNLYLQEIDDARRKYGETRDELERSLADYKKEAVTMSQNLKRAENDYSVKFLEKSAYFEKKFNQLSISMDELDKKKDKFDKVFELKNQLSADMEEIKDMMRNLHGEQDKVKNIEKQIREIESLAKSTIDKSAAINAERKKIDNLSSVITQLKNQFDETSERFSDLKVQGDIATRLNEKIADTNERYEKMEKVFNKLDETEQTLNNVYDKMDILNKNVIDYNHRADAFDQRLLDLDNKQQVYQQKFNSFESDSKLILKSERDINDMMDKVKQLDVMQQSLVRRTEEVNRLNNKVNDAMVKFGRIDTEADEKIRTLETLLKQADETPVMKKAFTPGSDQQDAVIRMRGQGFTIDQIANALHISGQEAEMLLNSDDDNSRRRF